MAKSSCNWKDLFSPEILKQGEEYYQAGKAKKLTKGDDGYSATVRGTRNYLVDIRSVHPWKEIIRMECNCEEGSQGKNCKHMAATLYLIEEEFTSMTGWKEDTAQPAKKKRGRPRKSAAPAVTEEDLRAKTVPSEKNGKKEQLPDLNNAFSQLSKIAKEANEERMKDMEPDPYKAEEYHYFDADSLLKGLNISKQSIEESGRLLRSGKCRPLEIREGYVDQVGSEEMVLQADLTGNDGSYYYGWHATVVVSARRVLQTRCNSYTCDHRQDTRSYLGKTLCEHELAALLGLQNYMREHNPGDATNSPGQHLLNIMRQGNSGILKKDEAGNAVRGELLRVDPYVTIEPDGDTLYASASFRIGGKKQYKIKNLQDTMNSIAKGEEQVFGSKTVMLLGREYIETTSLPWVDFIEEVLREDDLQRKRMSRALNRRYYYYSESYFPKISSEITLEGSTLDDFFNAALAAGRPVEIRWKEDYETEKHMVLFQESIPRIALEVNPQVDERTGIFHGVVVTGDAPQIIRGKEHSYYMDEHEGTFLRIGKEDSRRLEPLLKAQHGGYIRMVFGRNHLSDFYYKVLPQLKEIADVTEYGTEQIARYLPPEPEFVHYLDVENDCIVCQSEVHYGLQTVFLTQLIDHMQEDSAIAPWRDVEKEMQVLDVVGRYLRNYEPSLHVMYAARDDEMTFHFLNYGINELMETGEVHATERFKRLRVRRRIQLTMGVSVESSLMDLQVTSTDLTEEELLDVLLQYRKKRTFVRLKNGDFISLENNDTLSQLMQMMEVLRLSPKEFVKGKMQIPAYRALYIEKMLEQGQEIYAKRDTHFKQLIKEFKTIEDADYELPASLESVLRKYQKAGYRWLRTLDEHGFGGILADDMGLGKTLQVIAVILAVKEETLAAAEDTNRPRVSLVVCPASLVYNWGEEIRRFAPQLRVMLVAGTAAERARQIASWNEADVLVTSYDLLKRDIAEYEGKRFRFMVADEAQYIKNPGTAAAKSVKLVQAATRYALTGTPIENRLSELWSIFDYLMPGFLYEYETFRNTYETQITKYQDDEVSERLSRMVTPFVLRRLKTDVLKDLPDKLEEIRYAKMEKKQQKIYDGQVVLMRNELNSQSEEDFRRSKIQVLAELTRIRQICCDPSLCFEDYKSISAKREACMDLIRSLHEGGHKVLVFSQFTSMLEILEKDLAAEEIAWYKITGATPKAKRLSMVKAFNEDDVPVFLISLKAGGTGLNLTGADAVIHYDPWWNVAAQNQATDRAHRIGQTKIVTVYKMIMKDTIEEKILEMQETKQKLADDILSGEGVSSSTLTREDLLVLLDS